jgi:hypothetical protein
MQKKERAQVNARTGCAAIYVVEGQGGEKDLPQRSARKTCCEEQRERLAAKVGAKENRPVWAA